MRITTEHSSSSYGIPVILDDAGEVMDYAAGVKSVRRVLGLSVSQLAEHVGRSPRTIEDWELGRISPPAGALYVMAGMLGQR